VKETIRDQNEYVVNSAQNVKETFQENAENFQERAPDASENIKDNLRYEREKFENEGDQESNAKDHTKEVVTNFAENVIDKMEEAKERAGSSAENIRDKVEDYAENLRDTYGYAKDRAGDFADTVKEEVVDITDPISDTIRAGVNTVRRNFDKLLDVKDKILEKLHFKKYRGNLDLIDEKAAETEMIADWARNNGFEEIAPILKDKQFSLEKLSKINSANVKDELGLIDQSYGIRFVDAIDSLFDRDNEYDV